MWRTPASPTAGPGSGVSPGKVHVGQQEEFPGCSHQRPGRFLACTCQCCSYQLQLVVNESICDATGGGLLQRGLQGSGELWDCLNVGKDSEGLEETGPDEDLLLRSHRTCELGSLTSVASVFFMSNFLKWVQIWRCFFHVCLTASHGETGRGAAEVWREGTNDRPTLHWGFVFWTHKMWCCLFW